MKNQKSKSRGKNSKIYMKIVSWSLALAIVLPSYFVAFSPSVYARLQDTFKEMGEIFTEESAKYAFIGLDPETGTEVFFFDGSQNIKITDNGVTDGNAQYDEFSNKIVYQSLINGIWHIFLYDIETNTTVQLSYDGINNVSPQISQGQVVWQSWVDGHWEIYFYNSISVERLSFNETPDIEPRISGGFIVWRQYEDAVASDSFEKSINSNKYEILLFDSIRKETRQLTTDERPDSSLSLEYPYVVWQTYDGNDAEIVVHYILAGTTAFLTDNDHDDLMPRIKNGKIKWLENIEELPQDLLDDVEERESETNLELLPEWWEEPIECPQGETVCTFIDGEFMSYANRCFAEKAGAEVLHVGICTGEEEIPGFSQLASPSFIIMPELEIASESETIFEIASESEMVLGPEIASGSGTSEITPELTEDTTPPDLIISPSEDFEDIASPSIEPTPSLEEPIENEELFSEPGTYENTGSFDEEGDLIIEEHIPVNLLDDETTSNSESLPIVEDAQEPVVFEESVLMEIGEAVNDAITDTANAAANILELIVGDEEQSEETNNSSQPQESELDEELIEVVEEPVE